MRALYHRRMLQSANELLESADVARLRGVTPATVRRDASRGLIPVAAITPKGTRLFRREDAERYAAARRGGGVADGDTTS
jgi:predicted site-specific integrase-resolvase